MAKVFGPAYLPTGKDLSRGKVFQILVVHDSVDSERGTFEIMMPMSKAIKNSEEFLIVHVIVEFRSRMGAALESDGMEFTIVSKDGENARNGVIGCVCLDHNLTAGNPVMEYRSSCKSTFESVEGRLTSGCPIPPFASTSEAGEWNGNAGIAVNEAPIKVTKTKEGLNILHFPRYWPSVIAEILSGAMRKLSGNRM
jgi:hypothetical protein